MGSVSAEYSGKFPNIHLGMESRGSQVYSQALTRAWFAVFPSAGPAPSPAPGPPATPTHLHRPRPSIQPRY